MYNNYTNPYIGQQQRPQQYTQPQYMNYQQPIQPIQPIEPTQRVIGLQGKQVDSVDVVRAIDTPLDGSITYFPLADESAIVTKRLGIDGKSKIVIYKPIKDNSKEETTPKYITQEELESKIKGFNNEDIKLIKEDIKNLKRGLEDVSDIIKDKKGK